MIDQSRIFTGRKEHFGFPLSCILSRQPARHNSRFASSPPLRFGPPGVRSGTQPTVVVAKGKNLTVACSRAVRMVKESLRPETIQVGRCKEFFRSQVSVLSGKDSFAPKEYFPLLAFRTSERKPDTLEFPRDFRDSEYEPRKATLWHSYCHVGP
jgi:hypothetical protein